VLKTFPTGGVHPPENKLTAGIPIEYLPVPGNIVVPLSQHIGAPANPVVSKGDYVKTGQLIAEGKGFVTSNVHSPVSGKVSRIDTVADSSGLKQTAVFIDVEGDEWIETIDRSSAIIKEIKLSPEEIVKKCFESGIVGMGGAAFPSHIKLNVPSTEWNANLILLPTTG